MQQFLHRTQSSMLFRCTGTAVLKRVQEHRNKIHAHRPFIEMYENEKKTHQTPNRYLQSLCVFQWIRKIAHAQLHQRIINPRPNITSTYNSHSYTGITLVFIFLVLCVPMLRFAWIDLFLDFYCILFYFEWMKSQAYFRKKWFLTNIVGFSIVFSIILTDDSFKYSMKEKHTLIDSVLSVFIWQYPPWLLMFLFQIEQNHEKLTFEISV